MDNHLRPYIFRAFSIQDISIPIFRFPIFTLSEMQSGHFKSFLWTENKFQWSIGIASLISNVWRSLTCQRFRVKLMVKPSIIASLSACKKVAQSINSFLIYDINTSSIFDHAYPKHLEVVFTCPEFVSTFQKSVYSFYSFFRYSQCWSPVSRVLKPSRPYPPKRFSINFQF